MKLFFVPLLFSLVALIASTTVAAQSGVRQYSAIGVKSSARDMFDRPAKGWFAAEWKKTMGSIVNDPKACAFDKHYPAISAKFRWSEVYVNERIKPTRGQARDPNWSNYIWNKRETASSYVLDGISDALNSDLINHGRGIAKLAVVVGLSATSDNLLPPEWMRKEKSLTWLEGANQNDKNGNWHVRFDNPAAVEHAADFLAAFLAKYGNEKGLHSLNLGEYYLGQTKFIPSELDKAKYRVGVKNLWKKVVASAPRDADGKRINIVQTNPMLAADVTAKDIEAIGIGVSTSDTNISFPVNIDKVSVAMRQLYNGKKTHVMISGDARYACRGRKQGWDGTPNPFGHRKGYSGIATPQEIFWYHGEKGPVPTHSFFMTIATWCKGPQTALNFADAIRRFGRCGADASKWGVAPGSFSSSSTSTGPGRLSKPKPPIVLAN